MLFRSVFAADTEVRPSECSLLAQLGQPMARGRLTASTRPCHYGGTGSSGETLVSRTVRDLVAAPNCDLRPPPARSARARRSTPVAFNRCQVRSADSLASDACSVYRIGAEAAQSGRGSDPGRGLATADVRCN